MRTLAVMLESVFSGLDRRIEERWSAGNLSHGFWRTGSIPALVPVDTMREYGFWQARADLSPLGIARGMTGQFSVALLGGHTRMGLFLPNRLLEGISAWEASLTDTVSRAHDGQPAPIVRHVSGDTLFDRIFTEAPFSADWLLRCTQDVEAENILQTHLAWRVIDLWESAMRAVMSRQSHELGIVIESRKPLPPILTETVPLTLQDVYEIQPGRWITTVSMADGAAPGTGPADGESPAAGMNPSQGASPAPADLSDLEARLQALLPEYGITIQKEAMQ